MEKNIITQKEVSELRRRFEPSLEIKAEYMNRVLNGEMGVISKGTKGNIPILYANGNCLAKAWENAMLNLWMQGTWIRTQYDRADTLPSKDATMIMVVEDPLAEPIIHLDFPGGMEDLEEYRQEVVDGIKDRFVRGKDNTGDKKWQYTYHERMKNYTVPGLDEIFDQIALLEENIARSPITRRAQISTWKVWEDSTIGDPACLQSLWARMPKFDEKLVDELAENQSVFNNNIYSDNEGTYVLNFNQRFRSRDGYKAAGMNDFALFKLAKKIAGNIEEKVGEKVMLGRFMDLSDSFHIYGERLQEYHEKLQQLVKRPFCAPHDDSFSGYRAVASNHPQVKDAFEYARELVIPMKLQQLEESLQ